MRLVTEALTNDLEQQRREDSLKESERRFRSVADSAKDAIIVMDEQGCISFWNNAAEAIFGYTGEEVIGENLHKLLGPGEFYQEHRKAFPHFQKTGMGPVIGKTIELPGVRKNGKDFPMELSVSAFNLKDKWHAVGIVRDITERKWADAKLKDTVAKLKHSHSDLLSILNELRIGTALFDEEGKITFLSHVGEEVTGLKQKDVLKKPWEKALPFHIQYKDGIMGVFEEGTVALFFFPQYFFCPLSFGYIGHHSKHMSNAFISLQYRGRDSNRALLTIRAGDSPFFG